MKRDAFCLGFLAKIAITVVAVVLVGALPANGNSYLLIDDNLMESASSTHLSTLPEGFPSALRSRPVTLNPIIASSDAMVVGDMISLNLFADTLLFASVDSISTNINGAVTVRGRLESYPMGYLLVSSTGNNSLASIKIPETGEYYRIQMDTLTGEHYLLEENIAERDELEDSPPMIPPPPTYYDEDMQILGDQIAGGPLDHVTVDVMIVYTPAARQWANSSGGGIENVIAQAVAKGQLALDNSNTIMTINLVYSGEIAYTESGNSVTDLDRLTGTNDGYMDSVHTLRNQYGADVVGLFTNIQDTGGIAWLLNTTSGRPTHAFSITRVQQAATSYTYIHEMGHNMGCHHHKLQNVQPGPGLFSYSAGWRWIGTNNGRYCSVMTYSGGQYFPDGQTHTVVAYFSNPSIYHQGVPTGHAADGDNARNIREIKHVIAAYRPSVTQHSLNVNSSGASSVAISSSTGHSGTTNYTKTVMSGTGVTLTAPSTAGEQVFNGWTGAVTSSNQSIAFTMDGNKTVTANYITPSYTLTVNSSGVTGVTISSSTGHGGTTNYTKTVMSGTGVTLTAPSTADGKIFNGWTGAVTDSSETTSFTMTEDKTVMANYISGQFINIGSGTSTWDFPFHTWYHDARTQTIYLASEIGGAYTFESLALDVTTIPGQVMNNFTIRLKETDLDTYGTSPVWESSGWTTVYQSDQTVSATGWATFKFTTPFRYYGTRNLMVDICFNNSSYTSSGLCRYTSLGTNRSLTYRSDSGHGDPLTWSNRNPTPNVSTNFPNIRLGATPCPPADLTGDCRVDFEDLAVLVAHWLYDCGSYDCGGADFNNDDNIDFWDFAVLASQWLMEGDSEPDITWVGINDPGFVGEMSRYETTNAQYAQYLNQALATGDIYVDGSYVIGSSGPYSGQDYYYLAGTGYTSNGATNGGAARINYSEGIFTVDSGFENHPVTYVSWYGATAFADYYGWRLPTEWEWQAVASYNGAYTYGSGNSLYDSEKFLANYRANGDNGTAPNNLPYHPWVTHGTSEVGYFGTFGYGMADMAGNVGEWTSSVYDSDWANGPRVLRGGTWYFPDSFCAVCHRDICSPLGTLYCNGFRVCR